MKYFRNLFIYFGLLSILVTSKLNASIEELNLVVSDDKFVLQAEIIEKISNEHFFKTKNIQQINQNFYEILIKELDPNKIYFTYNEINEFINSQIVNDYFDLDLSYKILNHYFNRLIESTEYKIKVVEQNNFNYKKLDFLDIYEEDNIWKSDIKELEDEWFKIAKNDLLNSKLNNDAEDTVTKILKRYENRKKGIYQRNQEDYFSIIINTFTSQFDPHSSYLSPKSAEDFEVQMSLNLEGIGAILTTEDDYAKVVSLVAGGPAEKSNRMSPEDKIIAIKQEESNEFIDVVGWRIDEVVKLIRGKSGSKVTLEIIPAMAESDAETIIVNLTREKIELEERSAQKEIFTINRYGKELNIGVIHLPAFYIDFKAWRENDPDFKSSSKDVEKILNEFNQQNVDALIVDLRGNSGGSLYEANKLSGLFVAAGATVQVKQSSGSIRPWGDGRAKQVWTKPLAVLVDRYSASASEIFAGAIQDYQRGIVIGHRTFGKGTVQKLDDLSEGQIKITESKFYRVSGSSTQSKGIEPDIILPASWDIDDYGESSLDEALPWDTVRPIRHRTFNLNDYAIKNVKIKHNERLNIDPNLIYIQKVRERYDTQKNKKFLSLQLNKRKEERDARRSWMLETENNRRTLLGLVPFKSYEDMEEYDKNYDDVPIDLERDFLLKESTNIIVDYLTFSNTLLISDISS